MGGGGGGKYDCTNRRRDIRKTVLRSGQLWLISLGSVFGLLTYGNSEMGYMRTWVYCSRHDIIFDLKVCNNKPGPLRNTLPSSERGNIGDSGQGCTCDSVQMVLEATRTSSYHVRCTTSRDTTSRDLAATSHSCCSSN